MDASIPGRYGFKRRSEQRREALKLVWRLTGPLLDAELQRTAEPMPCNVKWTPALDPADGELDEGRAFRKRAQISSLAAHALELMPKGACVVEIGSGSGHLGILLAHLRPDAQVVLVEMKEYSTDVAKQRIRDAGITNCKAFCGTLEQYAASGEHFDLAVGLHTCGLLADALLGLAIRRGVAVCVCPCCYGQVASLKEDHDRGEGTAALMHPCSDTLSEALGDAGRTAFPWCASAADFTAGKGGEFDARSEGFITALRCMRTVDTDRLCWARERGYEGSLGLLEPPTCSPKCSVLRLVPPNFAVRGCSAELLLQPCETTTTEEKIR